MTGPGEQAGASLAGIDVAVLAGGLGTRLQGVLGALPKVLAPVAGRPFLDHLLDWLAGFGARRVVLCLGHRAERVLAHLAHSPRTDLTLVPLIEPAPLGTAGAVRLARPHLSSDPVLVLNGDTFVDADLSAFLARHRAADSALSLLCARVPSIARFGSVALDPRGRVARFVEKNPVADGPGLISAGLYLLSPATLDDLARRPGPSLEHDFLQQQPPGSIVAEVTAGRFIDIGTPESLAQAARIVPQTV